MLTLSLVINIDGDDYQIFEPNYYICPDKLHVALNGNWEQPIATFREDPKDKLSAVGRCMNWVIDLVHNRPESYYTQSDLGKIRRIMDILVENEE